MSSSTSSSGDFAAYPHRSYRILQAKNGRTLAAMDQFSAVESLVGISVRNRNRNLNRDLCKKIFTEGNGGNEGDHSSLFPSFPSVRILRRFRGQIRRSTFFRDL